MRKRLLLWETAGFLMVTGMGVLLHFLYDWTGEAPLAAAFSAVNESVWEHMKLFLVPMLGVSLIQLWGLGRSYPNFLASRAVSTLTGLLLIPVLFYTYTGALGTSVGWVNIALFVLAALAAFLVDGGLLARGRFRAPWQQAAGLLALWLLAFCFLWFTYRPIRLPLWRDPVTGGFGA